VRTELVTPPAEEPVSLAEAKLHLRVEISDDDALISALIKAARSKCETEQGRAYVAQTRDLYLDYFPWFGPGLPYGVPVLEVAGANPTSPFGLGGIIMIPRPPLLSVTSITYTDPSGTLQTLDPSHYEVSAGTPGRVAPVPGLAWPSARVQLDAVKVRYTCGWATADDVPDSIKVAIKLLLTHLYENRGDTNEELPGAVKALLACEDPGLYS
jgi:hypothetical protein